MTLEQKAEIDAMDQLALCKMWRFAASNPLLQGKCGRYFSKQLKKKGGFTSAISKVIGWSGEY